MRRERINYIVVGAFVLLMGAGLLVALYLVTGRTGPADRYHVYYSNVAGVKFGTLVSYEGFQVGQVEKIEPERVQNRVRFKVTVSVLPGWPIPEDSVARLVASGLLAAISIDIRGGASKTNLAPGGVIAGETQVNLFAALNEAANDFRNLSREGIKPLIRNLDEQLTALAAEFRSLVTESLRPLADALRNHVDDPALFASLKALLARLNASAGALQAVLGEENRERVAGILQHVESLSRELGETNEMMQGFLGQDTQRRVQGILAEVEALTGELGHSNELLQGFLDAENQRRVKGLLRDLDGVAGDLKATSEVIQRLLGAENQQHLQAFLRNLDAISGDTQTLVARLHRTRTEMDLLLREARSMMRDNRGNVTQSVADLRRTIEVLAQHVDAVAYHLEGSSRNLHEFTRQIRENPGLLLGSSPQTDKGRAGR